jgi:galactokinase
MNNIIEQLQELFVAQFDAPAKFIARAPGRVNLIGEHTDYNQGLVLPMAIDRAVWLAFTPNNTSYMNVIATNFNNEQRKIDLRNLTAAHEGWAEYIKGIAEQLKQYFNAELLGCDAVIYSEVPIGAGLSSSAALELAAARALSQCNKIKWDPVLMAQLAQKAENEWVGVNCGIMDQLICAVGKKNHAVLIDCKNLAYEYCHLPKAIAIVVMDTSTRRGLVESHYNERREQCEFAAKSLGKASLREVTFAELEQLKNDDEVYRRAKHVVSECERTLETKQAMAKNDLIHLGKLFKASHQSLAHDFEVTNNALNQIVAIANQQPTCYGARMTGAGFGGCAVALVNENGLAEFCKNVALDFTEKTGLDADIHVVKAEDGVSLIVMDA